MLQRCSLVKSVKAKATVRDGPKTVPAEWQLKLYVVGQTPRSLASFANIRRICEQHLAGRYAIEVIDLLTHPGQAKADQILAVPSLVRHLPQPIKKIVGDLGNEARVLAALEIGT
jgi:circadian clock protein KaiB